MGRMAEYPAPRAATLAPDGRLPDWGGDAATPDGLWPGEQLQLPSGRRLHLRRTAAAGGAAPGSRFVFVHGLGGSAANWTDLAGQLAGRGEGIALDLPGFGRSPGPAHGDWSQAERIRAVIEAIEAIEAVGDRAGTGVGAGVGVHLVGNSMGGAVALAVAALRPDLVRSLTLISPALPDLRVIRQLRRSPMPLLLLPGAGRLAERGMARMSARERVAATIALCVGDPAALPRARIAAAEQEAAERALDPGAIRAEVAALRGLVRAQLRVGAGSMWSMASRAVAPALVVWGGRDRLVSPDRAPRLCAQLPDARFLLLPDAGHVAMIEAPRLVARAVAALLDGSESQPIEPSPPVQGRPAVRRWFRDAPGRAASAADRGGA